MDRRRYSWSRDRVVPVLGARGGGPAERFADRLRGRHPAAVFFAALLTGLAALAVISVALGLLVTDVLLDIGELRRADNTFVNSLVGERTPFLTDASEIFSTVGGAPLLPILVGVIALVAAVLRQWQVAAFAAFALIVESATYRVTSLAVPRDRLFRGDSSKAYQSVWAQLREGVDVDRSDGCDLGVAACGLTVGH